MPSNTSSQVGIAKQFMPQGAKTYEKRVEGLQTNYNIFPENNNTNAELLSKGLNALGVALGQEDMNKEKRDLEVARALAPAAYQNAEDRNKLRAATMLANAGGYDISDNRYAVGIIDKLRGTELNNKINTEYLAYRERKRLAGTAEEEIQTYDDYYNTQVDWYRKNNPNVISNEFAFDTGLHGSRLEDTQRVFNAYHKDKNEALYTDRINGIKNQIDNLSRDLVYNAPDDEMLSQVFMNIMSEINATQGHSAEDETKLLQYFVEKVAKAGHPEYLDKLGEYWGYNGKPINNIVSIPDYYDVANKAADMYKTKEHLDLMEELDGYDTKDGFLEDFEKWKKEDPEKAMRVAPYVDQVLAKIARKTEIKQRQMVQEIQSTDNANQATAYVNSAMTGSPMKNISLSGEQREIAVRLGLEKAEEARQNGDYVTWGYLMTDPNIGGDLAKSVRQGIESSIAGGQMNDTLRFALHMLDSPIKDQAPNILGDKYGIVYAMNLMVQSYGEEGGLEKMKLAIANSKDSTYKSTVEGQLSGITMTSTVYNTTTSNFDTSVDLTSKYPRASADMKTLATWLMYAGYQASDALAQAQTLIGSTLTVSVDCVYPMSAYSSLNRFGLENGMQNDIDRAISGVMSQLRNTLGSYNTTDITYVPDGPRGFKFVARDPVHNPHKEVVYTEAQFKQLMLPYKGGPSVEEHETPQAADPATLYGEIYQ